jgi:hypothetical protein
VRHPRGQQVEDARAPGDQLPVECGQGCDGGVVDVGDEPRDGVELGVGRLVEAPEQVGESAFSFMLLESVITVAGVRKMEPSV